MRSKHKKKTARANRAISYLRFRTTVEAVEAVEQVAVAPEAAPAFAVPRDVEQRKVRLASS
jgi:hypothetical protein